MPIAVAAVVLVACGASDAGEEQTTGEPVLVSGISIWADITSQVACGAEVTAIVPSGADPHDFEPSLRDRELLDRADLVVLNGGDLEARVLELVNAAAPDRVVEMTDAIDLVDGDPHIWQDPLLVARALDVLGRNVIAAGADGAAIEQCVADYRDELVSLDAAITEQLVTLPAERRVMVTSHDALGYFAARYGLTIAGTVIPSTSTLAETNAADLAALATVIDELSVPAIFTEELESAADADALAARLGVSVIPLVTDALAESGPASTYVGMLRANAESIFNALREP